MKHQTTMYECMVLHKIKLKWENGYKTLKIKKNNRNIFNIIVNLF